MRNPKECLFPRHCVAVVKLKEESLHHHMDVRPARDMEKKEVTDYQWHSVSRESNSVEIRNKGANKKFLLNSFEFCLKSPVGHRRTGKL